MKYVCVGGWRWGRRVETGGGAGLYFSKENKYRTGMETHGNSGILFDIILGTSKFINTYYQNDVIKSFLKVI